MTDEQTTAQRYANLKAEFDEIDRKYNRALNDIDLDFPPSLGLQKLTFLPTDEDTLWQMAEDYYHGYYQHKIAQVTQSNLAKQSDKNAKLQQASTDFDTKCQTLLQKYKQKKLNLTQKALSNCLVASTIYLKELQRLEDEYNQQVNSVTQAHQQAVSKLNYQLQLLQQLLQDATQHLQGQQEAKTAQKMFDLQLDEQKRSDSVTKYNNSVDKQETDYKVKIEKAYATVTAAEQSRALQAINLLATVGVSGVEKLKSEEKVALARPFFDTLSRAEAQQLFSSDVSLEYHFGTYYDYMKEYVDNLPN